MYCSLSDEATLRINQIFFVELKNCRELLNMELKLPIL